DASAAAIPLQDGPRPRPAGTLRDDGRARRRGVAGIARRRAALAAGSAPGRPGGDADRGLRTRRRPARRPHLGARRRYLTAAVTAPVADRCRRRSAVLLRTASRFQGHAFEAAFVRRSARSRAACAAGSPRTGGRWAPGGGAAMGTFASADRGCVPIRPRWVYASPVVKRTNINLDLDLVEQAAHELGTRRTTDTVHEALRDVIARARRVRLARRNFADLTPDALEQMRRPTGRSA